MPQLGVVHGDGLVASPREELFTEFLQTVSDASGSSADIVAEIRFAARVCLEKMEALHLAPAA